MFASKQPLIKIIMIINFNVYSTDAAVIKIWIFIYFFFKKEDNR